ncbi:MAG TPA: hypothetical protein VKT82_01650 [Ktedonobacterales bacterium]|nr:hypothetical protein [Ktedonobacterales bacterium]
MGKQIGECNIDLALKLEAQDLTYDEIAERAGYASRGAVWRAIRREQAKRGVSQATNQRSKAQEHLVEEEFDVHPITIKRLKLLALIDETDTDQILTQMIDEAWQRMQADVTPAAERKEDAQP